MTTADDRKQAAMDYMEMAINKQQPREAIERYVGDEYIQHNPAVADGKQGFIEFFERFTKETPDARVEFKRALIDDAYVVLQGQYYQWVGGEDYAGIDIFRFDEKGKIVEHWDVLQPIPDTSANDNTMF